MRRLGWLALVLLLGSPGHALAWQPKCPLPLDSCLVQFGRMRERPWIGVRIEVDSLGQRVVHDVLPGSPAEKAGVHAGDVLERIDGKAPQQFFAGRAGWKAGDRLPMVVRREGHDQSLALLAERIPDELFARMVGEHMLEGHLAYVDLDAHAPH